MCTLHTACPNLLFWSMICYECMPCMYVRLLSLGQCVRVRLLSLRHG